jgi:hypothetical protein
MSVCRPSRSVKILTIRIYGRKYWATRERAKGKGENKMEGGTRIFRKKKRESGMIRMKPGAGNKRNSRSVSLFTQ